MSRIIVLKNGFTKIKVSVLYDLLFIIFGPFFKLFMLCYILYIMFIINILMFNFLRQNVQKNNMVNNPILYNKHY